MRTLLIVCHGFDTPPAHLSIHLSVNLSACLSVILSVHIHLSVSLSTSIKRICLSIQLSINLSIGVLSGLLYRLCATGLWRGRLSDAAPSIDFLYPEGPNRVPSWNYSSQKQLHMVIEPCRPSLAIAMEEKMLPFSVSRTGIRPCQWKWKRRYMESKAQQRASFQASLCTTFYVLPLLPMPESQVQGSSALRAGCSKCKIPRTPCAGYLAANPCSPSTETQCLSTYCDGVPELHLNSDGCFDGPRDHGVLQHFKADPSPMRQHLSATPSPLVWRFWRL